MEICIDKTDFNIRSLKLEEAEILKEFLYDAIFVPEGMDAPPMEIVLQPELQVYIRDFGKEKADIAFLAEAEGKVIGAVWVRIMNDYGHIDDETPSFAISVKKEFRGKGIGTKLMQRMFSELKRRGYNQASLSVQKQNHAVNLYKRLGFRTVGENEEELIMVYRFI